MTIHLSVSGNFHNKENRAELRWSEKRQANDNIWALGAFSNVTMPPSVIVTHITSGKAICIAALSKNWRNSSNFASAQIMGIDLDESPGVDALLEDKFVSEQAFLVYPTASHSEGAPRSRILFALDEPITDPARYKKLLMRLMYRFNLPIDEACKDVVRIFYGSDKAEWQANREAVLPVSALEALPFHPDELKALQPGQSASAISDYNQRKRAESWALRTKQSVIDKALGTPEGQRHIVFNSAVMNLISKSHWPGLENVEADLRWLGQQMLRDEDEIESSIRGAKAKGEYDPLVLPDRPTPAAPAIAPDMPDYEPIEPPDYDEMLDLPPAPAVSAELVVWRTSDQSMARYRERLRTPRSDGTMPLIFPFKSLWSFGGAARILDVGVMVGIVGMSGGMKTSFCECTTEPWRQMDANDGCWWGTEWTWEKMADRAIQRHGGAPKDEMSLHELWLIEEAQNIPKPQRNGVRLSDQIVSHSEQVSQIIESWPGKNHQMVDPVTDVEILLTCFKLRILELRSAGRNVRYCVWDYVQLLDLYSAKSEADKVTTLLGKLKMFCIEMKVIGIAASQVTKSSSGAAKSGDDVLQAESGQFFRSDKFNLVLTLNPVYEGKLMTNRGVINVAKNSDGKTGLQTVFIDPSKYKWIDKKVPENQQVRQEDLEDVEF